MERRRSGRKPKSAAPYLIDANGCWVWQRAKNNRGYGLCWNGEKMLAAHRHYWIVANGPISDGLQLDHKCRNRACVNPAHLEPVTGSENTRRGLSAKLTVCDVERIRIRANEGISFRALAKEFGVSSVQIGRIVKGTRWASDEKARAGKLARSLRKIAVALRKGGVR